MMIYRSPFALGEIVYLRVATERKRGMVTMVAFTGDGGSYIRVLWEDRQESNHYAPELSHEYVPNYETSE